jgi:CBS domain-containing protein
VLASISEIMSSPVQVVGPIDTLAHARNLMLRNRINRLVVVDAKQKPIGILTRTDIAHEVSSRNPGPKGPFEQVLVQEVMSKSPLSLKPGETVMNAAQTMLRRRISGVPIVDDEGALIGILSKSDIARYYAENCHGLVKISEVETHQVTTIPSSYTLYKAKELMRKKKIGRLVVLDGATPIGIITLRDLSFAQYSSKGPEDKYRRTRTMEDGEHMRKVRLPEEATVEDVMRTPPITIRGDEDVDQAARLMTDRGFGGVPVVDTDNNLTGIVTKTDVAKALIIYDRRSPASQKRR